MSSGSPIRSASHRTTNDVLFRLITERLTPTSRVLDFGAGRGHMVQRLAEWFAGQGALPSDHVVACEVVPESFEYAGVPCHRIGFDSVIPFPDGHFDLIYAIEVLEHTRRPYDFLEEVHRKLRPGGWLIFSVPNILHLKARLAFLFTGFPEMFGPPSVDPANGGRICGHIMPLGWPYFSYGLRRAGFEALQVTRDRSKRACVAWALLLAPFLWAGSALYRRALRRYDSAVWTENRAIVGDVNGFDLLTSRSCVVLARKPATARP